MTRTLCFTVDVDRDVNDRIPGRAEAVSLNSGTARFDSSEKGSNIILDLLDETGIKATFFAEARTLSVIDAALGSNEVAMHGLDHEDMTGEVSGIRLSERELSEIMRRSSDIIKDRTGKVPKGFRAPYMRTDERIMKVLSEQNIAYDSSSYAETAKFLYPYDIGAGMKEVPVPEGRDRNGKKIAAYLWPMHEGKRKPEDYIEMADTMEDGIFVIATHSWHIVESRSDGKMDVNEIKKNAENVRTILTALLDKGFKAVRMIDAV